MTTKIVYSFDPNTRAYLGPLTLDRGDLSPLDLAAGREVWMLPGNCVEVAPPAHVEAGNYAAAVDGAWEIREVPVPVGAKAVQAAAAAPVDRVLSPQESAGMLYAAVQQHLDMTARAYRFTDIAEAVTYAVSPIPKFYGQGRALQALRDRTWALVEPILDDIADGKVEPMKFAALAPKLPVYDAIQAEADTASLQASVDAVAAHKAAREAPQEPTPLAVPTQAEIDATNAEITAAAAPPVTRRSRKGR